MRDIINLRTYDCPNTCIYKITHRIVSCTGVTYRVLVSCDLGKRPRGYRALDISLRRTEAVRFLCPFYKTKE